MKTITYVRVTDGKQEFDLPEGHPWITSGAVRRTKHGTSHVRRPAKPVVPLGQKATDGTKTETTEKGGAK